MAHAVTLDSRGNAIVAGYEIRDDRRQVGNWLILKYGTDGTLLWRSTYDGPTHLMDSAWDVAAERDGTFVVVGNADRSDLGQSSNWLIRKYVEKELCP